MLGKKNETRSMLAMLLSDGLPLAHRVEMVKSLANHDSKGSHQILAELLDAAKASNAADYMRKSQELNDMLEEIRNSPRRLATFVALQAPEGSVQRAVVTLEGGHTAFPIILEPSLANLLQRGDNVMLDAQARGLVGRVEFENSTGEAAYFERRIGDDQVEVSIRGDERHIYAASKSLLDAIERGELSPGRRILVCPHRYLAFSVLPEQDGRVNYRFLDRSTVPQVSIEQHLGSPPRYIADIRDLVLTEMTKPGLRSKYGLHRCAMKLLTGMPGTGKSYSILALIREIYEVISDVTGLPLTQLPPRVMRLRPSSVLSKWLGESDKNIARFFQEIEQLAGEPLIVAGKGEYSLPVIVILEEIDGLARNRGEDPIMDRILTTLLELFDPTRSGLKDKFVIFLGTTNKAHLIDPGFLRRIGGTIERFAPLDRGSFGAVLRKQLFEKPVAAENGSSRDEALDRIVYELTAWLFSPNGDDRGQVMLHFIGHSHPEIRHRRDFLTAGLVGRSVQCAAEAACMAEARRIANPGLTATALKTAVDEQIQAIIGVLRADNVFNYLDLPDGIRVQHVQVIEQPEFNRLDLMRAA